MGLECVRLLRLPGDCRALVSAEVAELGERLGEMKRLDAGPAGGRQAMRHAKRVPMAVTSKAAPRLLGEIG